MTVPREGGEIYCKYERERERENINHLETAQHGHSSYVLC